MKEFAFQSSWLFYFLLIFLLTLCLQVFYRKRALYQKITKTISSYSSDLGEYNAIIPVLASEKKSEVAVVIALLNSLVERLRESEKKLKHENHEKEAIFESLLEGVISFDEEGKVRYVNFTASKLLGIPRRYLVGKPLPIQSDTTFAPFLEKCKSLLSLCKEKEEVFTDSVFVDPHSKIYVDLIVSPIREGSGMVLVMQDKSSHHKVLEMGKDFVSNASHELRTPITIIRGFAETLQDLPQISKSMLSNITEKIVRNCERMEKLVKNLLTLADIENLPESRFQACDVVTILEKAQQTLVHLYPSATMNWKKKQDGLFLRADRELLELALSNLLHNAAKYSTGPAEITIEVEELEDELKIMISDKGIGIPEENLEHIFDRFYTVDKAHSRRLGGAGLGLSIVKNIIQKHDGVISVSSKVGEGSCFTILLPLQK
ncbi:MAG: PAS domain-containing protein [Chlamydiae bacterium]|nr:PAS domain-containing protein [Chlamydiota bacterium]